MAFPTRHISPTLPGKLESADGPDFSSRRWLVAVGITFLVGLLLLVDQHLETTFEAAEVIGVDRTSGQIITDKGKFLTDIDLATSEPLDRGDLVVMERSPLTNTVVAYREVDALLVESPREIIFSWWPIPLIMTLISIFLIIRWNHTSYRAELLILNLILLVIISLLYFISH